MMEDISVPEVRTEADQLSAVEPEYVCWLDLMGVQNTMSTSVEESTIDMLNLHVAVDEALDRDNITHYPVMDGVYLTADSRRTILPFLRTVFSKLAKDNIENKEPPYNYVPRAAVSYGPVIHGKDISDGANEEFMTNSDYAESLLIGLPMIQAIKGESKAPPFGIYIDESARAFAPDGEDPIERIWHEWFRYTEDDFGDLLLDTLEDYYDWCESSYHEINYELEDIERHREMANQYFTN
ncbi:hypothetical protein C455_07607 [Haloferax larsenii JCM 13917]|nr:hypothetical protein [Haloferax larsenii]ELZ79432.1 hypothetical protein C455_07607 [Haloferax larsenii JCM 13917]